VGYAPVTVTAADVYRALWRHKFFIALFTGILAGATWYLTSQQTPIYQASTLVRIQQRIGDTDDAIRSLDAGERLAQTYAEIVQTRELARRMHEELGDRVPISAIRGDVSARPVQDLELLRISARSPSPEAAAVIANAAPPALRGFIAETGTLRDQIITIDRAQPSTIPVAPDMKFNLTVAILLGLMLNGALALLIELLSDRLPSSDELEQAIGRPVLGTIPPLSFTRLQREPLSEAGSRPSRLGGLEPEGNGRGASRAGGARVG
jgi:capsular polysaccharide biosynthesis protein